MPSFASWHTLAWLILSSPFSAEGAYENRYIPPEKDGEFTKFRTRPDLRVPVWIHDVYDEHALAPGYWFVSPYENVHPPEDDKPPWVAPTIYDFKGRLVWSAGGKFDHRNVQDFRVSNVNGEDHLTAIWQDGGVGFALDSHYESKLQIYIGKNMDTLNIHDWNWVDNGTRVLNIVKDMTPAKESWSQDIGFDGRCNAEYQTFYERDGLTGKELFTWKAHDYIPFDETTFRQNDEPKSNCDGPEPWDFLHVNSVDKCPDHGYVMSARHTDTIYKISSKGSIEWRLGGIKDSFTHGFTFSRQHHVRCHGQNETHTILTFLDNAVAPDEQPATHDFSRGLLLALDHRPDRMVAEVVTTYDHPKGQLTDGRGSMQVLPNGNIFMGWSGAGKQSEYTSDGRLIMESKFRPGYLRTYRSYKFPWVGHPIELPEVVSEVVKQKRNKYTTDVYVSWNGATEVAFWNLYKSNDAGNTTMLIQSTTKEDFETKMSYYGYASYVVAEALNSNGEILGRSEIIKTETLDKMPSALVAAELEWIKDPSMIIPNDVEEQLWLGIFDNSLVTFFLGFFVCAAFVMGRKLWLRRRGRPIQSSSPQSQQNLRDWSSRLSRVFHLPSRYERLSEDEKLDEFDDSDSSLMSTRLDNVSPNHRPLGLHSRRSGSYSDVLHNS